jgi:hypothetical protein
MWRKRKTLLTWYSEVQALVNEHLPAISMYCIWHSGEHYIQDNIWTISSAFNALNLQTQVNDWNCHRSNVQAPNDSQHFAYHWGPFYPKMSQKHWKLPFMGSISSTWVQSKALPTSLFCKCVQWCHSWPAHCIPHLPIPDRWHLCQHFVTWTVNPLMKCSSTNMMSEVLSEWHHTNEYHGSAKSYPLQWPVKNVSQH